MLQHLMNYLNAYLANEEEGQTLVEYGVLLALIAIVVIVVLALLGPAVADIFQQIIDAL